MKIKLFVLDASFQDFWNYFEIFWWLLIFNLKRILVLTENGSQIETISHSSAKGETFYLTKKNSKPNLT